jgi:hypothetical protein
MGVGHPEGPIMMEGTNLGFGDFLHHITAFLPSTVYELAHAIVRTTHPAYAWGPSTDRSY